MADSNDAQKYKADTYYELGTRVRRAGIGFGAHDSYGTVVRHDFFGAAVIDWDQPGS